MTKKKKIAKIKWGRYKDGRCESKCGRFAIVKDDEFFVVRDAQTGKSRSLLMLADTKLWADNHRHDKWPKVYHTYDMPTLRDVIRIAPKPYAFNGSVGVIRYRVTVEPIDEPEAIRERIEKLWRECNNHHLWGPIQAAAKHHGVELSDREQGKDAKTRW